MTETTDHTLIADDRVAELKKLAKKATPGEWFTDDAFDDEDLEVTAPTRDGMVEIANIPQAGITHPEDHFVREQQANAAFIAAANPQTVVALIVRMEEAERNRNEARALASLISDHAKKDSLLGRLRDVEKRNSALEATLHEIVTIGTREQHVRVADINPEGDLNTRTIVSEEAKIATAALQGI